MDRKEEQSELIYKLGLLLSPLQDVVNRPEEYDAYSRSKVSAKFFADASNFENDVRSFTLSEPGHSYDKEWRDFLRIFNFLKKGAGNAINNSRQLEELLEETSCEIRGIISRIPADVDKVILEAHTPFSTYCKVRDLCQTVTEKLTWVDRYLDATLFYRYLRDVPDNTEVVLLTWPKNKRKGNDYTEFEDASKLYAKERGTNRYRLVVHPDIHDRWLCCDKEIYSLGGSIKDASQGGCFTLTKVDSTVENLERIDKLLETGKEIFGPTQQKHL